MVMPARKTFVQWLNKCQNGRTRKSTQAVAAEALREYDEGNNKEAEHLLTQVKFEWYHSEEKHSRKEGYLYHASRMKQAKNKLKPNGISHTVYPDQPCTDFDEWSAYITRQEVARDADTFKAYCDQVVEDFQREIQEELKDFHKKFDGLWDDFKNSITG
jgi:hypothetical protein